MSDQLEYDAFNLIASWEPADTADATAMKALLCSLCRKLHATAMFTPLEMAKTPHTRQCKLDESLSYRLRVCEHTSYMYQELIVYKKSIMKATAPLTLCFPVHRCKPPPLVEHCRETGEFLITTQYTRSDPWYIPCGYRDDLEEMLQEHTDPMWPHMNPCNSNFQRAFDNSVLESGRLRGEITNFFGIIRAMGEPRKTMEFTCPVEGCDTTVEI
jgi:hypothetical protein